MRTLLVVFTILFMSLGFGFTTVNGMPTQLEAEKGGTLVVVQGLINGQVFTEVVEINSDGKSNADINIVIMGKMGEVLFEDNFKLPKTGKSIDVGLVGEKIDVCYMSISKDGKIIEIVPIVSLSK